jgi:hypothetical protein
MPIESRNILKQYYLTGLYPTQQQFFNWLESFIHKTEDGIAIVDVTGLAAALNAKADASAVELITPKVLASGVASWLVPAGTLIEKFLFIDTASITVKLGTTLGGNDIFEDFTFNAGGGIYSIDKYFPTATTIFFTGFTGSTITKIFKR